MFNILVICLSLCELKACKRQVCEKWKGGGICSIMKFFLTIFIWSGILLE